MLITLIRELRKRQIDVILINHPNGVIAEELAKEGILFTVLDIGKINESSFSKNFNRDDVLVITSFKEALKSLFPANPHIIYYNVDGRLADMSAYKFNIHIKKLTRDLLIRLLRTHSLALMDDTGIVNAIEKLNYKITDPFFLPIPIRMAEENLYDHKKIARSENTLRLGYIGRSVAWKLHPLKKILDDIACLDSAEIQKIEVVIVVDSIDRLKTHISIDSYTGKYGLKISLFENILPSAISDFLLDKIDINFAMGTAALESAKLGIPTVLVDYSDVPFPDAYQYNWLFETTCFSLGRNITRAYDPRKGSKSMRELLTEMFQFEKNVKQVSEQCFEYVKRFHASDIVVDRLVVMSGRAQFRLRDARKYILYYRTFHRLLKNFFISKPDPA